MLPRILLIYFMIITSAIHAMEEPTDKSVSEFLETVWNTDFLLQLDSFSVTPNLSLSNPTQQNLQCTPVQSLQLRNHQYFMVQELIQYHETKERVFKKKKKYSLPCPLKTCKSKVKTNNPHDLYLAKLLKSHFARNHPEYYLNEQFLKKYIYQKTKLNPGNKEYPHEEQVCEYYIYSSPIPFPDQKPVPQNASGSR